MVLGCVRSLAGPGFLGLHQHHLDRWRDEAAVTNGCTEEPESELLRHGDVAMTPASRMEVGSAGGWEASRGTAGALRSRLRATIYPFVVLSVVKNRSFFCIPELSVLYPGMFGNVRF